jgi:hypothetical protein
MSLDVYLEVDQPVCGVPREAVFFRRNGATVEITRDEWDLLNPDQEPVTVPIDGLDETGTVFSRNITHNLCAMARAAGIYQACWRPEEIGIERAEQLVPLLTDGLQTLRSNPRRFLVFNPVNGWGDYEGLVGFVEAYLSACRTYPEAKVRVSR